MKFYAPLSARFPFLFRLPDDWPISRAEAGRAGRGCCLRGGGGVRMLVLRLFAVTVLLVAAGVLLLGALARIQPHRFFCRSPRLEQAPLQSLNRTFLVDTPGCHIPNLEVMSPEVREFVYDYADVACDELPPLVRSDGDTLFLEKHHAGSYGVSPDALRCCARALWLQQANFSLPDVAGVLGEDNAALRQFTLPPGGDAKVGDVIEYAEECLPLGNETPAPAEFVRVECEAEGREVYRDFHGFVRQSVRQPPPEGDAAAARQGLSVLLLGADNVSRLNLLRKMPRTEALLRRLGGIIMLGYNKVDDYSYLNLVPLLAGQPSREMEKHCLLANSVFFDPCPWIWKWFSRRGFRTALMEDTPRLGLFHFHSPGFARRPVDVDSRALLLAAERELPRTRAGNTSPVCLGPRLQIQGLFDLALKFLRAMVESGAPFFHYVWGTSLTHDYLNQAQIADPVYERFIEDIVWTGVLNRTALVFLSDHGNRVGPIVTTYQGHVEDRLPVLTFVLPPWWHRAYPLASATLRANTRRLVTVMDVHETALQLADLASLEEGALRAAGAEVSRLAAAGAPPRAISLLLPVPASRTCEQAGIVPHFCACVHLEPEAVDHPQMVSAARLLVDNVNAALAAHPMCAQLHLHAVRDARRGRPSSTLGRSDTPDRVREEEFLVTVETQPGGALLAGTVRHLEAENVMRLAGRVTRLNKYGNTSWCMPDRELLLYCYCDQ